LKTTLCSFDPALLSCRLSYNLKRHAQGEQGDQYKLCFKDRRI